MIRRALFVRVMIAAMVLLSLKGCAPTGIQQLTQSATEGVRARLASYLLRELDKSSVNLLAHLSSAGGFLSDPRVRILLPPPLGVVAGIAGIAGELTRNPEAALLEVLLNQAAEQAIPGASPILRQAIAGITPSDAQRLFSGEPGAVTDFLRENTETALREALLPSVAGSLADTEANRLYADLLEAHPAAALGQITLGGEPQPAPPVDLASYVTDHAIDGVFKLLGERETLLRRSLESFTPGSTAATAADVDVPAGDEP